MPVEIYLSLIPTGEKYFLLALRVTRNVRADIILNIGERHNIYNIFTLNLNKQ